MHSKPAYNLPFFNTDIIFNHGDKYPLNSKSLLIWKLEKVDPV